MTTLEHRPSITQIWRREPWPRLADVMDLFMPMDMNWRSDAMHSMRVEESMGDGRLRIRAELPGMDPEKDMEIEIADGVLTIRAHREERTQAEGRSEFRYGRFMRSMALPPTADEGDVHAHYRDGILEVTVALREEATGEPTKVPITRAETSA